MVSSFLSRCHSCCREKITGAREQERHHFEVVFSRGKLNCRVAKRTTRRHPTIKLPDSVKIDAEKAPQNVKRKYECNTMYTDFREDVFLKLIVATK